MPQDYVWVYVIGAIIAATIIAMSTCILIKSIKRAKQIGMTNDKIKTAVKTSALFSIVPSIPIVIGVGIMMSFLGLAIPWIRLTVIGALQYELLAMDQVGLTQAAVITPELVATACVIMTISIISGPLFNLIFYKKFQTKLADLNKKNKKLLDTVTGSLLGGIMAGLASYIIVAAIFSESRASGGSANVATTSNGYLTLITLGVSAFVMALCGVLMKVFKWKWLENYALPITILVAMGAAYGLSYLPVFAA